MVLAGERVFIRLPFLPHVQPERTKGRASQLCPGLQKKGGSVGRGFSTPIGRFARREKRERKERDEIYAQLDTIQLNLKKIRKCTQ
jgi:hypothetical protein